MKKIITYTTFFIYLALLASAPKLYDILEQMMYRFSDYSLVKHISFTGLIVVINVLFFKVSVSVDWIKNKVLLFLNLLGIMLVVITWWILDEIYLNVYKMGVLLTIPGSRLVILCSMIVMSSCIFIARSTKNKCD